jgi:hypothetical protein
VLSRFAAQWGEEDVEPLNERLSLLPDAVANRRIGTSAISWFGVWTTWLGKGRAVLNPGFGP